MPICSYVVFSRPGQSALLAQELAGLPGCSVEQARNRDLLLLLTETDSPQEEQALQRRLEEVESAQCMVLTFGDIDVEAAGAA